MQLISRADAVADGLKGYFTGEACVNGHLAERRVRDGKCVVCALNTSLASARKSGVGALAKQRYRERNRQVLRDTEKARRTGNSETVRAQKRAYAARNAERERQRALAKYYANRSYYNNLSRVSRHRRRAVEGSFTAEDVSRILKMQRGRCAYCPRRLGRRFHVDHIEPVARNGTNHPYNIQLACPRCNRAKSDRDPIEFARSLGLLL
jgi:5-methylcytosine-specific restriction endonuclease McrA